MWHGIYIGAALPPLETSDIRTLLTYVALEGYHHLGEHTIRFNSWTMWYVCVLRVFTDWRFVLDWVRYSVAYLYEQTNCIISSISEFPSMLKF